MKKSVKSKKWLSVIISCLMMIFLAACANAEGTTGTDDSKPQTINEQSQVQEQEKTISDEMKKGEEAAKVESDIDDEETAQDKTTDSDSDILVVYFSRTGEQYGVGVIEKGNTAIVAEMIIEYTQADSFEIVPKEDYYPYTYNELTEIAKQEQNENARPEYSGEEPDFTQYSTIYIGAPVWWGDWPMICYTFFENNAEKLAGKTLIPFSTHGGSGLAGFDNKLAMACPGNEVGTGLAISGSDAQNNQENVRSAVHDWIEGQQK